MAAASFLANGEAIDIENIIYEMYEGKFKDKKHLHDLIRQNKEKVYRLMQDGMTNLGAYIGDFSLDVRSIIPVLLGQAIELLPQDRIDKSLEERLCRIMRNSYSPRFNQNSQNALSEIERKVGESNGKLKDIYSSLHRHYQETLKLQEELN